MDAVLAHTVDCQWQEIVTALFSNRTKTRRPASADRTVCCQFQATGQPVSRTQTSDAMTSRLPRYEAKCVQRTCFQWGSVPLRSVEYTWRLRPYYAGTTVVSVTSAKKNQVSFRSAKVNPQRIKLPTAGKVNWTKTELFSDWHDLPLIKICTITRHHRRLCRRFATGHITGCISAGG